MNHGDISTAKRDIEPGHKPGTSSRAHALLTEGCSDVSRGQFAGTNVHVPGTLVERRLGGVSGQTPKASRATWLRMMQQLGAARAAGATSKPHRYNSRPPGVIRPGSATDDVLRAMREAPGRHCRHAQLLRVTGRTGSAVDWALYYLRSQGIVEIYPATGGQTGLHRYCLVEVPDA